MQIDLSKSKSQSKHVTNYTNRSTAATQKAQNYNIKTQCDENITHHRVDITLAVIQTPSHVKKATGKHENSDRWSSLVN
jgi:hypothetical protein